MGRPAARRLHRIRIEAIDWAEACPRGAPSSYAHATHPGGFRGDWVDRFRWWWTSTVRKPGLACPGRGAARLSDLAMAGGIWAARRQGEPIACTPCLLSSCRTGGEVGGTADGAYGYGALDSGRRDSLPPSGSFVDAFARVHRGHGGISRRAL